MDEVAGIWDYELERIVQRMLRGGATAVKNHDGEKVVVRVEKIEKGRCGSNTEGYAA